MGLMTAVKGEGVKWIKEGKGIYQRMYMHNPQTQQCGDGQGERCVEAAWREAKGR